MQSKKILFGAIIWFLGFLIPVGHHIGLSLAAVQEPNYSYTYHKMAEYFFYLPWVDWVYLLAMVVAGLIVMTRKEAS